MKNNAAEVDALDVDGADFEAAELAAQAANDTEPGPRASMLEMVRAALDPDLPF